MVKAGRIAALLVLDILIINISFIGAYLLRFEFDVNSTQFEAWFAVYALNIAPITVAIIIAFGVLGIYTSMWRYAGADELTKIVMASIFGELLTLAYMAFSQQMMPRSIYIISGLMIIVLVSASRMTYRLLRMLRNPGAFRGVPLIKSKNHLLNPDLTRVMIVGAGEAGAAIVREIKQHPEYGKRAAVMLDDDVSKQGKRINGVKVAGDIAHLRAYSRKYSIDEIIIAIPSASRKTIQNIVNECNKTRCKIKILPTLIDLINDTVSISKLRDVDIEDLLGREPVKVNLREISGYLEGQIVLVTGGGGSIGSELCRQIARFKPRKLIALDIYENTVFELANEIKHSYPMLEFEAVIGSVRSKERMREIFEKYRPHVVFHAAAHKHVPLMEMNPKEAVVNNILGTRIMIDLSEEYAVTKFVMISTDKAVNPTNVMGCTKRAAELILQEKSRKTSKTRYSAVRFGNVLGSNGSVIPIFRKQIESGGPVTVTHPDITRYFMTIPEAVQLVIQTGAMAMGGEIFVLDMGEPVKIMDLAENVIRLSGYIPNIDIDIAITGLRPGEKLYEELLLAEEGIEKTGHDKIYVGHPLEANDELKALLNDEGALEHKLKEVEKMSDQDVKRWLHSIVPNYTPNGH